MLEPNADRNNSEQQRGLGKFWFSGKKPKKARHETSKSSITEKAPSNAIKNNKVDKLTDFKEGNKWKKTSGEEWMNSEISKGGGWRKRKAGLLTVLFRSEIM